MRQGHGRIVIVLDRSGSMQSIAAATVESFNEFVNGQKAVPGTADVLFVQFDDQYEVVFDKPLTEVSTLTGGQFVPRGYTALRDAIGRTIDAVGKALSDLSEDSRPDSVTFVILTDGHENASKIYDTEQIAAMIKHQSEVYNWKFVFLGANQDAILTAAIFNIPKGQAMSYAASAAGIGNAMAAVNRYSTDNRMAGVLSRSVTAFSDEERKKSMGEDADTGAPV